MRIYSVFALPCFSAAVLALTWGHRAVQSRDLSAASHQKVEDDFPISGGESASVAICIEHCASDIQYRGVVTCAENTRGPTIDNSAMVAPIATLFRTSTKVGSQPRMPLITSVEPDSGRIGDELTAKGNDLGSDSVAALYLTDGKIDLKAPVLEQKATSIRFRIPVGAKPGRFALMVLTTGIEPKLLEQPVKITVEEASPT